jgi:hypothetical protein
MIRSNTGMENSHSMKKWGEGRAGWIEAGARKNGLGAVFCCVWASGRFPCEAMNSRLSLVLCAFVTLMLAAPQAHAQVTTAQPTGFLQDYHRLGHVGGVPLEQVWINPEFDVR